MKKVLLCDVDGTLFDSHEWWSDAFYHTAKIMGFDAPPLSEFFKRFVGVPLPDIYRECAPDVDAEKCIETHVARQMETLDLVVPFEGVPETLRALKKEGVKLAIVTSRRHRKSLLLTLKKHRLGKIFEAIIAAGDVAQPKPDPAGVFLALKKLGVKKDRTYKTAAFMVGDSTADIRAGKSAGIKTIGVLWGMSGESLRQEGADYCVRKFSEVKDIVLQRGQ